MDPETITFLLYLVVGIVGLVLTILWILLPFLIYGMSQELTRIRKALDRIEKR